MIKIDDANSQTYEEKEEIYWSKNYIIENGIGGT